MGTGIERAMMLRLPVPDRERIAAAGGAVALTLSLGLLFILGLQVVISTPERTAARFEMFDAPNLPVEVMPSVKQKPPLRAISGGQERPLLAAAPVIVVAPAALDAVPAILPIRPGADRVDGAGGNATGAGTGTGTGVGAGKGTGVGPAQPARRIEGYISLADYPEAAQRERAEGNVRVRYTVRTNGRVADCTVTASSGSAVLDDVTCGLIARRFIFRPARDESGRPVAEVRDDRFAWRMVE